MINTPKNYKFYDVVMSKEQFLSSVNCEEYYVRDKVYLRFKRKEERPQIFSIPDSMMHLRGKEIEYDFSL